MMSSADYYQRAMSLYDERRFAEAADCAAQGLDHDPDNGGLWQLFGTARCNPQDFAGACDALERTSLLVPLHPLAHYALASCYHRLGQIDLAALIYTYLAESVASTALLAALTARLGEMARSHDALKVCERITDIDPGHHAAHFGVAFYLCRIGLPAPALILHLAMALDLAPDVTHYRLNLAFNWAEAGDCGKAHELLKPIAVTDVRCPRWLGRMRDIYAAVSDTENSRACQHCLDALAGAASH